MKQKKKCLVIFTEGETDEEFYNNLIETIKAKYKIKKFDVDEIVKRCIRGICKFENKLVSKFKNEIIPKYKGHEITVCLCYDTDVFTNSVNPPIDRNKIEKKLKELGAIKVIHLKAEKCIEDLFLYDIKGICEFLKIKIRKSITGKSGVEKMEKLFNLANRSYQKGYKCEGLIKSLDMEIIVNKIENQLKPLIEELISEEKIRKI